MKKYHLTPAGLRAYHNELLQFDDRRLGEEATALAADPVVYLTEKFEVDVLRLEAIIGLSPPKIQALGWFLAALMLSRGNLVEQEPLLSVMLKCDFDVCDAAISVEGCLTLKIL